CSVPDRGRAESFSGILGPRVKPGSSFLRASRGSTCRYTLADRTQADRVCAVLSRRVERIAEGPRPGRAEDDSKLAIANRPVGSRNSATPRTEIPAAHPPLKVDR